MIYTSYHFKFKEIEKKGITPICISLFRPRFQKYSHHWLEFCPTKEMINLDISYQNQFDLYNKLFLEKLSKINKDEILKKINLIQGDIALCCYEKDYETCHRYDVAAWLHNKFGYDIQELKFTWHYEFVIYSILINIEECYMPKKKPSKGKKGKKGKKGGKGTG